MSEERETGHLFESFSPDTLLKGISSGVDKEDMLKRASYTAIRQFRVKIAGIQCRNLLGIKINGLSNPYVVFQWGHSNVVYQTPEIKNTLNPTWKGLTFAFDYEGSLQELKQRKLTVLIYSTRSFTSDRLLGSAAVDLFTVATGPVHHDHHLVGCENGRVVFNCYMDQINPWSLDFNELSMKVTRSEVASEAHDLKEDQSLKQFAISYKFNIGMEEYFSISGSLKKFDPLTKLSEHKLKAGKASERSRSQSMLVGPEAAGLSASGLTTSSSAVDLQSGLSMKKIKSHHELKRMSVIETTPSTIKAPATQEPKRLSVVESGSAVLRDMISSMRLGKDSDNGKDDGGDGETALTESLTKSFHQSAHEGTDSTSVVWTNASDHLDNITRTGTFEECISGTLKIEIRSTRVGQAQLTGQSDPGFLRLLEKFEQQKRAEGSDINLNDLRGSGLYGQCWLTTERLYEEGVVDYSIVSTGAVKVKSKFTAPLTLNGHQVGILSGSVTFNSLPDIRQMQVGVISEHGISGSSTVIVGGKNRYRSLFKSSKKTALPEEAQRIAVKLDGLIAASTKSNKENKEISKRKAKKMLRVLQSTHKASMLSWLYASEDALGETRTILMRVWKFVLDNIRVRDSALRNTYYNILFYLLKRGEFGDLGLLGFDPLNKKDLTKSHLEICLKYRKLLLETKDFVLQSMSVQGVMAGSFMFFAARIISTMMFRLPHFGREVFQIWQDSYGDSLDEFYRTLPPGFNWTLNDDYNMEPHLDWRVFHRALEREFGKQKLKDQEESSAQKFESMEHDWRVKLRKYDTELNRINILTIDQWTWYILDTLAVLKQKISWEQTPGYRQALQVFFEELKHHRAGQLPTSLFKASCTLLADSSLLNPMVTLLLSSTCVFDIPAVRTAVELLGVWIHMMRTWKVRLRSYRLTHLERNDPWGFSLDANIQIPAHDEAAMLPPTFDYRFLCSALRILLQSEHVQVQLVTLEFLYNCWDIFPERQAEKIRYELKQVFMKYFLHWNVDSRYFFHHLLAFRVLKARMWTLRGHDAVIPPPLEAKRLLDQVGEDFYQVVGSTGVSGPPSPSPKKSRTASFGLDLASAASGLKNMMSSSSSSSSEKGGKEKSTLAKGLAMMSPRNMSNWGYSPRNSDAASRRDSFSSTSSRDSTASSVSSASIGGGAGSGGGFHKRSNSEGISSFLSVLSPSGSGRNSHSLSPSGGRPAFRKSRSISWSKEKDGDGEKVATPNSTGAGFGTPKSSNGANGDGMPPLMLDEEDAEKLDALLQQEFQSLLHAVFAATKKYVMEIDKGDDAFSQKKVSVSWKKRGVLLKQAFMSKSEWREKHFYLRDRKLGYSDTEGGPIKREMGIVGATIRDLPEQVDSQGSYRNVLKHCFEIQNGLNKWALCAPRAEDLAEWLDLLEQSAAEASPIHTTVDPFNTEFVEDALSDVVVSSFDYEVPEHLLPYGPQTVKEWLEVKADVDSVENALMAGYIVTVPSLEAKYLGHDE